MKKIIKILIGGIFIICILLGLGYLGLAVYYENGFSFQTYINGIYCTGKSVEAVNMELNEAYVYEGLTVVAREGTFYVKPEDISYTYDYREPLNHYLTKQNSYLWIENLTEGHREYTLLPAVYYSHEMVENLVKEQIQKFNPAKVHQVALLSDENGFTLIDTKQNILDSEKAVQVIKTSLEQGLTSVNLEEEGCYYNEPYTESEKELLSFYEKVNDYQTRKAVFLFGEDKEELSTGDMAATLACYEYFTTKRTELPNEYESEFTDEENRLLIDEEAAEALLEERFQPYNTYQNHTFTTHDGRTLQIKGGTYGNQIAMKTEKKEFSAFLHSEKRSFTRVPEYTREAALKGKNDIGTTYIEVDIGQQKMFYYQEGELYLETDVVTGKNSATREEVCYVYAKQRNRILRGPGYESFVKYWMPVSGGIGIHDASWRSEYGSDIYIRDGSHGCINTPLEIVEQMYEAVEIGTPCIIYYGLEKDDTD